MRVFPGLRGLSIWGVDRPGQFVWGAAPSLARATVSELGSHSLASRLNLGRWVRVMAPPFHLLWPERWAHLPQTRPSLPPNVESASPKQPGGAVPPPPGLDTGFKPAPTPCRSRSVTFPGPSCAGRHRYQDPGRPSTRAGRAARPDERPLGSRNATPLTPERVGSAWPGCQRAFGAATEGLRKLGPPISTLHCNQSSSRVCSSFSISVSLSSLTPPPPLLTTHTRLVPCPLPPPFPTRSP